MKKMTRSIFAVALAALLPATAMAQTTNYSICPFENCNRTVNHTHNGDTYGGHYANDGHDYHPVCNVNGCQRTANHTHNGHTYDGHYAGDGHPHHQSNGSNSGRSSQGSGHHRGGCHR